MGTLLYDGGSPIEFDDRTLAHLQIVIGSKLRRGESFYFSWPARDGGRTTIWLHPTLSLRYDYTTNEMPALNRAWVDRLAERAYTPGGLVLLAEPETAHVVPQPLTPVGAQTVEVKDLAGSR